MRLGSAKPGWRCSNWAIRAAEAADGLQPKKTKRPPPSQGRHKSGRDEVTLFISVIPSTSPCAFRLDSPAVDILPNVCPLPPHIFHGSTFPHIQTRSASPADLLQNMSRIWSPRASSIATISVQDTVESHRILALNASLWRPLCFHSYFHLVFSLRTAVTVIQMKCKSVHVTPLLKALQSSLLI